MTDEHPLITRRGGYRGGLLAALVVVGLGLLVKNAWPPLVSFDRTVDEAVHTWALHNPWAVDVSRVLETMGRFWVCFWVTLATTAVLLILRRWWQALTLVLLALLAPWVANLLKPVFARPRPVWTHPLGSEVSFAYPSGHACAGIAVYAACAVAIGSLLRSRNWGAIVATAGILLGLAIGLSRLVLGVHWPSDVVGGWAVALAFAGILGALLVLPPAPPPTVPKRAR